MDVPPGALIALIGPNGGGKTTLLKTIAGLLPPLTGSIDAGAGTPAYLPPPGALTSDLPVGHLVALGRGALRGWSPVLDRHDRRAAMTALDALGIADLADRPFDRISSGQGQLALIARLIVQDAALCLLDEPTALLDPPNAFAVERAIRLLASEGRAVIASTHHLPFAARADLVITAGATIEQGAPAAMLSEASIARLYSAQVALCPCCHQPMPATISA